MKGPMSWYGAEAFSYTDDPGEPRPGTVGAEGEPLRCVGGPLDGLRMMLPAGRDSAAWEYPEDRPSWERQLVIYVLARVAHVPFPGTEGPVAQELVWMAQL